MNKFDKEELLNKTPNTVKLFLFHFIKEVEQTLMKVDQSCSRSFKNTKDEFKKVGEVINKNADVLSSEIKKLTENDLTLASSLSNLILQLNELEKKQKSLSKEIDLLKAKSK